MADPVASISTSRVLESLVISLVSGGASWLVTWGVMRERVEGLRASVERLEEAAKECADATTALRDHKADRSELAALRGEIAELRSLIAGGFDRVTNRIDGLHRSNH